MKVAFEFLLDTECECISLTGHLFLETEDLSVIKLLQIDRYYNNITVIMLQNWENGRV